MNIYVIRHGQTNLNLEKRIQARNGEPLNENGIAQAELLRDEFKKNKINFNYVYSSPQERAVQTAQIASGIKPVIDDRLDVYDLGTADRMLLSEVKFTGTVPDMTIYSGVETIDNYKKRIYSFITEILEKYKNQNINILISGHKCTTGMIGAFFENFEVNTIYDDFLKLSSENGKYKKYEVQQIILLY